MPHLLAIHTETDEIADHMEVDEEDLGDTVESLYSKLSDNYSLEILYDTSDRPELDNF
jgi:hypothetical protein